MLDHVQKGQKIKIGASDWNAMIDAAKAHKNQLDLKQRTMQQTNEAFRFYNATGLPLEQGYIIQLDGWFNVDGECYNGIMPTSDACEDIALVDAHVAIGEVGRCWRDGTHLVLMSADTYGGSLISTKNSFFAKGCDLGNIKVASIIKTSPIPPYPKEAMAYIGSFDGDTFEIYGDAHETWLDGNEDGDYPTGLNLSDIPWRAGTTILNFSSDFKIDYLNYVLNTNNPPPYTIPVDCWVVDLET